MLGLRIGDKVVFVGSAKSSCPNASSHDVYWASSGCSSQLQVGTVYTVKGFIKGGIDLIGLLLEEAEARGPVGFCLGTFRKVEKADEDFVEQMRSMKPKVREKV